MFKEKPFNVILFCSIFVIISVVLKFLNPDFGFLDGGLIIAIVLTILVKDEKTTYVFGLVVTAIILFTGFYGQSILNMEHVWQTLFSVFISVLATISVIYVKRLYHSLESEQHQVTALFEHATEGIILTDQLGNIILINPAALKLFQYEREELIGKPIEVLLPGSIHSKHVQYRKEFYEKPANRSMGHGRDLFAKSRDGKKFPVEVSLSYYQYKGQFYVIAFLVDITERKESEKRMVQQKEQLEKVTSDVRQLNTELETKVEERTLILKEALHELERSQEELSEALDKEKELNEIKSRFVSMASHEFRTPLSTVLSSASLIGKYKLTEEQDRRDKHVRRIKDSVKHLNDLLEDFLSLGKLEEGKVSTQSEAFVVKDFLEEVVEEMRTILKPGQDIKLENTGPEIFNTDKKLVKNILINLLSNAAKFSDDNQPIWLTAQCADDTMVLSVQDEGIGISTEDQQHMFSSFFRGKNAINIQGTGLGLHIVKRYADLLGGEVFLHSELGKGTKITIELPSREAAGA